MSRPRALITGPTAGIGLAFAKALALRGYDFVLVARDEQRLGEVAATLSSLGADSEIVQADLSDRSQLKQVEQRLGATTMPIDLLINNAGFGLKKPFLVNDVEAEQAMLDVLVTAPMRLSHAAMKPMVERGSGGVINVSSVAGYLPRGTYSAAKAYVTSMSEWADATYRSQGVRTMALCPGFTRTEFHARMDVGPNSAPSWLWLDVDALVKTALKDFDSGKAVSVPDFRYKALTTVAKYTPTPLAARFQKLGRK